MATHFIFEFITEILKHIREYKKSTTHCINLYAFSIDVKEGAN